MDEDRAQDASSRFTRGAKKVALASWGATAFIPAWSIKQLIEENKERSAKKAAQGTVRRTASGCGGCLSVLVIGMTLWMFAALVVLTLILMVDAAVAAFALLATVAWGFGAGVDRFRQRQRGRSGVVRTPAA